jgi:trans-2,3-dihydro-3-hydroxyanthranilate isomerase
MPAYEFVTVDVFTETRFGGNPLAVFPDARGLSDVAMQAVAKEFNLSETTFVLPPDDPAHRARVRIFTPATELPFAGHPNVGTGYVLASRDAGAPNAYVFEELAGLVPIGVLRGADGAARGARIEAPRPLALGAEVPAADIAACAGLAETDVVVAAHRPVVASVGTEFVVAQVSGLDALGRARPDIGAFRAAADRLPGMQLRFALLAYARLDAGHVRARMFAPLGGVLEDPATGSANAALAALLASLSGGPLALRIEQGVEMGRPSLIEAEGWQAADGWRASVAGSCVPVMRGTIEV